MSHTKKTIKIYLKDYTNGNYFGTFEKKINYKKINKTYLEELKKQGWFYASNFIDPNNFFVLEFVRNNPKMIFNKNFNLAMETFNFFDDMGGNYDNLISSNSNYS